MYVLFSIHLIYYIHLTSPSLLIQAKLTLQNDPQVLPNGDLKPEYVEVIQSLWPENQLYFEFSSQNHNALYL